MALARLSLLKQKLNLESDSSFDNDLVQALRSASEALERETARVLEYRSFASERYMTYQGQNRLYVREYPLREVTQVAVNGTAIAASSYDVVYFEHDQGYVLYPAVPSNSSWDIGWSFGNSDGAVTVSYTAGYYTYNWETASLGLESSTQFNVPADLENAVAEYAAIVFLSGMKQRGNLGLLSINRTNESFSYDKYLEGYPDSFKSAVERYRRC